MQLGTYWDLLVEKGNQGDTGTAEQKVILAIREKDGELKEIATGDQRYCIRSAPAGQLWLSTAGMWPSTTSG